MRLDLKQKGFDVQSNVNGSSSRLVEEADSQVESSAAHSQPRTVEGSANKSDVKIGEQSCADASDQDDRGSSSSPLRIQPVPKKDASASAASHPQENVVKTDLTGSQ